MVFELTDKLCEYPLDREEQILICVTNLLIGYYEGNHLLMASELLCDHFQSKLSDSRAKSALNYLKNHCSFSYDVDWVMQVVINDDNNNKREISIDFFEKTSSIQPVCILGENTHDVDFFVSICKMYYEGISINHVEENGVDTDKKFDTDDYGKTYKDVFKTYNKNAKHISLHTLNFHEIENLLPFSFLMKVTNREGQCFLRKIATINDCSKDILRYYDIKNGVTIDAIEKNPAYYIFAEQLYNKLYKLKGNFNKYICDLKRKKKKNVYPPIRQDAINLYLSGENIDNSINYFEDEWRSLAKNILTFTCARENSPIS